jgi:hypothetical protein
LRRRLRSRARFLAREDGQGVVEFALLVPVLLLVIFGAIELGRAWNNKNDAVHLANEAVRMAAVNRLAENCGSLRAEVSANGLPGATSISVTAAQSADPVTATVNVPFTSTLAGFLPFLPSSLSATATMRAEQDTDGGSC